MFSIKELKKLKAELLESLIKESKSALKQIPKEFRKKSEFVLIEYIKTNSIAGLELWVNGVSEYIYFIEAKKDLQGIKENLEEIKEFQKNFTENLKIDFGIEDFRFIDWERSISKYSILNKILEKYSKESLKNCYMLEKNVLLGNKSDYKTFQKTDGDPSKKGLKIKTIAVKTPKEKLTQIEKAHEFLEAFWPEGFELFLLLTDKIHIIQSNGLVSYSHFNEQGISYINFMDRDILESIDDLTHENAHHHLNLILKKYKIIKRELKEDIFYSPWRKSLRPLYAILHATFTFSFGALLFYNITKSEDWVYIDLDEEYKQRAYSRFIEETISVEYSLFDLKWAISKGLFTAKGISLVESLSRYNEECLSFLPTVRKKIISKSKRKELDLMQKTLQDKRILYKLQ